MYDITGVGWDDALNYIGTYPDSGGIDKIHPEV